MRRTTTWMTIRIAALSIAALSIAIGLVSLPPAALHAAEEVAVRNPQIARYFERGTEAERQETMGCQNTAMVVAA